MLVSESEEEFAKSLNIYLGKNKIIIHNGVINRLQKNNNSSQKFNNIPNNNRISVISVCRFVEQKNIYEIINIAKKLPRINFVIIGDGILWCDINNLILRENIKNIFLRGLKNDVFKYLYSSDIYLSTSLYEGLPISILEAMSIGLPIVASKVVGNIDTVENGISGYLYDLHNVDMAAKYINNLAYNSSQRNYLGNNAFKRQREKFSLEIMLKKYKYLYSNKKF